MATVPTMLTWADGDIATATRMNENFRDPAQFLTDTKPHSFARQLVTKTNMLSGAYTTVVWDFEDVDTDNAMTASYYDVKTAGWYTISGCINYAFNATGQRGIRFTRSVGAGAKTPINGVGMTKTTIITTGVYLSVTDLFAVGDRIYCEGWQDSGVTITTDLNYAGFPFRNETSYMDVSWQRKN